MTTFVRHLIATLVIAIAGAAAEPCAAAQSIGVSMAWFDDRWLTNLREAMQARAKELGVRIQFQDAQGDIGKQINQVQNFVSQRVSIIIVNPVDTAATPRVTKLATSAAIPLVYVNRRPDEAALPKGVIFVGSDERVSGKLQGEAIARLLNGKGNVAIMLGELSSNATTLRTRGVEEVVKRNPQMRIVAKQGANYQRIEGMNLMSNWILSGKKIDAIAANNDEMAIGAIMALRQSGRDPKSIVIAGVDGSSDALAEIGRGNLDITVFQDARGQGRAAVDSALELARGQPVEPFVWIPFELVTKENYKEFLKR